MRLVHLVAALVLVPAASTAADRSTWRDQRASDLRFVDARLRAPATLPLEADSDRHVALPFAFPVAATLRAEVEATLDGRLVLAGPDGTSTVLNVLAGVKPGPDSRLVHAAASHVATFRWVRFLAREVPVTFEAHLGVDGRVRFQYLDVQADAPGEIGIQLPAAPGAPPRDDLIVRDAVAPASGFALRSGALVEFDPIRGPRDVPEPDDVLCPPAWGLPPDGRSWCDVAAAGPDGMLGTPDDMPTCIAQAGVPPNTACSETASDLWRFEEADYCQPCRYVFYVTVDCGREIHLPFHDTEGMAVTVTDLSTGEPVVLRAKNECVLQRERGDYFAYCDACVFTGAIIPKDDELPSLGKAAGSCLLADSPLGPQVLAELPCLGFDVEGLEVAWGRPLDLDGDGSFDTDDDELVDDMDEPVCTTCLAPDCPCGTDTPANQVTEGQLVDVWFEATPSLGGVYRIELTSGSFVWELMANCGGAPEPLFDLYSHCADALAAYDPLPELALDEDPDVAFFVEDETACPDAIGVGVTLCNLGSAAAGSAPFAIDFEDEMGRPVTRFSGDNADHPSDAACQLPLEPGECRTCSWAVVLPGEPNLTATVRVDDDLEVLECSEDPDRVGCELSTARRAQSIPACSAPGGVAPLRMGLSASGRLVMSWEELDGNEGHDIYAGDLAAFARPPHYAHDEILACDVPRGTTAFEITDAAGAGRSRYYLLVARGPGGELRGTSSSGEPRPPSATPCR